MELTWNKHEDRATPTWNPPNSSLSTVCVVVRLSAASLSNVYVEERRKTAPFQQAPPSSKSYQKEISARGD